MRTPSWRRSAFVAAAGAAVALPVAFTVADLPQRAADAAHALVAATAPPAEVLQASTGVTAGELELLRRCFAPPAAGQPSAPTRLVCYYPIDELPEATRPAWTGRLDVQRQVLRNLLYPWPRDGQIARDAVELARWIEPGYQHRLVVVDLRQNGGALPGTAEFDLLHEQTVGLGRVRYWSLRKAGG
jgi:hypothetical protein